MYLSKEEIEQLLNKKDLTKDKEHAISILIEEIAHTLKSYYNITPSIISGNPIVSLDDNYYSLNYQKDEITLSSRYTKYIDENTILRTQMTSVIPSLLRDYVENKKDNNELWMCPGLVYRRDVRDKTHVGEPHQMDIWYLTTEKKERSDLLVLVKLIISVIENYQKKKIKWRYTETSHNYTDNGIEVEIYHNGAWLEILECGLISNKLLNNNNLAHYSGLALGLGLERLVMIIKEINDIRILYSEDTRIKEQMKDMKKYKEVSNQPSIKRDLSIAINQDVLIEEIIESLLSEIDIVTQNKIESINMVKEYLYNDLPDIAKERLGMSVDQKNMLIRITLRDLSKSMTNEEANEIYSMIYKKIHKGNKGYLI